MAARVVAALISRAGSLLVCQRKAGGAHSLKWEFPGGKVEPGESDLAALQREVKEELDIDVRAASEIFRHEHRYSDGFEVELIFFRVSEYTGTVANLAFQRLLWVAAPELDRLDFLEGDLPLLQKLARGEIVP